VQFPDWQPVDQSRTSSGWYRISNVEKGRSALKNKRFKPGLDFLLNVLWLLIMSAVIVPPSPQSYLLWGLFAKVWSIRLAIVMGFVAVSRGFRGRGSAEIYRLTPLPTLPKSNEDSARSTPPDLVATAAILPKALLKNRWIYTFCTCVFIVFVASGWHSFYLLRFSPGSIIDCLFVLFISFCLAAFIGWVLSDVMNREKRSDGPYRTKNGLAVRQWLLMVAICIFIAAGYWITHSAWLARQAWVSGLVDTAGHWTVALVCFGCFVLFFLPKSSDQPELLHVAPSRTLEK
jgi:hypothetical protein